MKSLTTIQVQGEDQEVWEVYLDDTREQTFGFIFDEDDARQVEDMLARKDGRGYKQWMEKKKSKKTS
jgi:hypothetical protein